MDQQGKGGKNQPNHVSIPMCYKDTVETFVHAHQLATNEAIYMVLRLSTLINTTGIKPSIYGGIAQMLSQAQSFQNATCTLRNTENINL